MAASTAASPGSNDPYDVFINHCGDDSKNTFASHLYHRIFSGERLRVFLDKQELPVGHEFPPKIKEAISTASVHVAIFSPRYAESEWCLNELLYMLESKAPIIPVFYQVKPADLKCEHSNDGVYSQALRQMEEKKTSDSETKEQKLRYSSTTIQKWSEALDTAAKITGLDLQKACNGDEGQLVEMIVKLVLKNVKRPGMSHLTRYTVGLKEKVESFENKVLKNQQSEKGQIVGVVGMGGIGKTTLAIEVFNRKSSNYEKSCFLHDVRASKSSLHVLQRQLLAGLGKSDPHVNNPYDGKAMLRKHFSSSFSYLIVLDNVDDRDQVDALLPDLESVLSSGSFVLITSRDIDVLTRSGVENSSIYYLDGLNQHNSLELFCKHAFSQPDPPLEFKDRVDKFVTLCDGFPLSLEVFGALLYRKTDMSFWDARLDRLQKELDRSIEERLLISYETLDTSDKNIFLDIACVFIGENRDMAIKIWDGSGCDGSGWNGSLGFLNLQNRCLVQVDSENRIKMHDHVRDLGRNIARKSGSPYFLWPPTENIEELFQRTSVKTELVRGIRMRPSECEDNSDFTLPSEYDENGSSSRYNMNNLQLLDIEGGHLERLLTRMRGPNLIWLRWEKCPCSSLPSWTLTRNLRVLEVHGNELEILWQSEKQAPSLLRELKIRDAPLSKFPESIGKLKHLERIYVNLKRGKINFETLPEEFCNLRSLISLELLNCSEMKSLPELFGNLTNLRHIDLKNCSKLERLPNSFGKLTSLKYLNLYSCSNLIISSETLGNIRTLEYVNLSYCHKIEEMPPQITLQRSLKKLYCGNGNLKELPSAIGDLTKLEILHLGSRSLTELPDSVGLLTQLIELRLDCSLTALPDSVGLLTQLIELRLDCPIRELPFKLRRRGDSSIGNRMFPQLQSIFLKGAKVSEVSFDQGVCPNLQYLIVHNCALTKVGTLPNTLIKLELYGCASFRSIEGLCDLAKLEMLYIRNCQNLESVPGLEKLRKLRVVALSSKRFCRIGELLDIKDLRWLEKLIVPSCAVESIQGLEQLTKLRELDVTECFDLRQLAGVEHLRSLEKLKASGCRKLKSIQVSDQLAKLRELDVYGCSELEELPGIEHLRSLEVLKVSGCGNLKSIQVSDQLTKLPELDVSGCSSLEELQGVEQLRTLEKLKASGCQKLKSIKVSGQLTKLRELDVYGCSELEELPGIEHLRSLEVLKVSGCGNLKSIQVSDQLTKLPELDVSGCSSLEELQGVEQLRSLERLMASYCQKLKSIKVSGQLTKLRVLDVSGCSSLEELQGVEYLRSLEKFNASGCENLKSIQVSDQLTKLPELDVSGCSSLEELQGVEQLRSLEKLKASGCLKLKSIKVSGQLTKLRELDVSGCSSLEELQGVEHLRSLENLTASSCEKLNSIKVSGQLRKLRELDVSGCFSLEELQGVEHLRSLENLKASGCEKLNSIKVSDQLTKLQELDVTLCCELKELLGVEHLRALKKLKASGCKKLKSIQGLHKLINLRELDVAQCFELRELPAVEHLSLLEKLNVSGCEKLKSREELEQLIKLREPWSIGVWQLSEYFSKFGRELSLKFQIDWKSIKEQLIKIRKLDVSGQLIELRELSHRWRI